MNLEKLAILVIILVMILTCSIGFTVGHKHGHKYGFAVGKEKGFKKAFQDAAKLADDAIFVEDGVLVECRDKDIYGLTIVVLPPEPLSITRSSNVQFNSLNIYQF